MKSKLRNKALPKIPKAPWLLAALGLLLTACLLLGACVATKAGKNGNAGAGGEAPKATAAAPKAPATTGAPSVEGAGAAGGIISSRHSAPSLPRAHPGYVQWLEHQSMLAAAPYYTRLVSGTELLWRAPAASPSASSAGSADPHIDLLLEAADTWLFVQSSSLLTENLRPVLAELGDPKNLRLLSTLGIQGLYLMPTGEEGSSLHFAAPMGNEAQYAELARLAGQSGQSGQAGQNGQAGKGALQLGSALVPAASSLGPDFLLAARHVRDYPGSMVMVDIPKEFWPLLPAAGPAADSAPAPAADVPAAPTALAPTALAALAERHLLPPALVRDGLAWASPGGWAATAKITGVDGVERRFVYRYDHNPTRPVLQWDDPGRGAQRILSASAIRTIGSQQQTLAGLYLEAMVGLDGTAQALVHGPDKEARVLEPAASALRALSREIRRYGGWSMQGDVFPPHLTQSLLDTGVDFTVDSVTSPAAELALLTGDAGALKSALQTSLVAGIDQRRLVRSLPGPRGLDLRPLLTSPQGRAAVENFMNLRARSPARFWSEQAPCDGKRLQATAATLAAMATGIAPEAATRPESAARIRQGQMLLTSFRAALPGLLLLSGQDLTGSLNLAPESLPTFSTGPTGPTVGAWALSPVAAQASSSRSGLARAPVAYAPLTAQMASEDSYARQVATLSTLRQGKALARATLVALPDTGQAGTVALITRLPRLSRGGSPDDSGDLGKGGHLLIVANFSGKSCAEDLRIPASIPVRKATDLLALPGECRLSGHNVRVALDPWQCRLIGLD